MEDIKVGVNYNIRDRDIFFKFNRFYVYALLNPEDESYIYIGKGKKTRMFNHELLSKKDLIPNNNKKLFNKLKKIFKTKKDIIYKLLFITDNEEESYCFEKETILKIGVINLCNISEGGVGGNILKNLSDREEYTKKLSKLRKGRKKSKDHKESISLSIKKYWGDPNNRIKQSKKAQGRKHSKETKEKISISVKNRDPSVFEKTASKNRGRKQSELSILKRVNSRNGYFHTEETKKKIGISNSLALKGKFLGSSNPFYGRSHTKETLKNISEKISKEYKVALPNETILIFKGTYKLRSFLKEYNHNKNKKERINFTKLCKYKKDKELKLI